MKTIISTLIALVFFVAPTFVAAGVARPESSGKGHISVKERRQLPPNLVPTVDLNSQLANAGNAASNVIPAAPGAPAAPAAAARRSLQDRD